jgi:hypothetical protein
MPIMAASLCLVCPKTPVPSARKGETPAAIAIRTQMQGRQQESSLDLAVEKRAPFRTKGRGII